MKRNTYEVTLLSGAKVRFRATPGAIQWASFADQQDGKLYRLNYDQIAAVVRLR